jgi:ribulose-5-phosphate 4-epimerase/fuculose-1-phosphate aldolase
MSGKVSTFSNFELAPYLTMEKTGMSTAAALVTSRPIRDQVSDEEWEARVDLAACYRLMARFGLTDLIYNHITAKVPGPEHHFLINGYGLMYDEITASSLHKIDIDGNYVLRSPGNFEVNPAGYIIHSAIHSGRDDAGCVIHTHSRAATAVSAMECGLLPLSQSSLFFYGEHSYHAFEGSAINPEERARLVADLGNNNVMFLHNHGTLVVGHNCAHAFLLSYQLENACRIQVDAMAAGKLITPSDEVAASVPPLMRNPKFSSGASLEWKAMRRLLDRLDPSYAE